MTPLELYLRKHNSWVEEDLEEERLYRHTSEEALQTEEPEKLSSKRDWEIQHRK